MAQTRSTDGIAIDWEVVGDGPTVVLVHGITERRETWAPIVARLADDHRVVTLDLRGHGASQSGGSYDLGTLAADVGAVIDECAPAGAHLVGHSLGGAVVSAVAGAREVRSVVNVDQSLALAEFKDALVAAEGALRDPASFPFVIAALFDSMRGPLSDAESARVAALRRPDQAVVLGIWAAVLELPAAELERNVDATVSGCRAPYLSLFGIDPGPGYDSWLQARIPTATVERWADHGHYPHLVDPDRFVDRLRSFWATID
jgi:pimeloyl-ACP methyl ester carboxylesterase